MRIFATLFLGALLPAATLATDSATKYYWDLSTFKSLRSLRRKLKHARLTSMAPGGHALWEKGQMRVPESSATVLRGDFTDSGKHERAVIFETGDIKKARRYLLIARKKKRGWKLLHFASLNKHPVGNLVWDPHNQRIGIDTGKKRRKTRAATMTWAPGQEPTGQYGYVIEEILILPFKWNPKKKRFEKQELAWFDPDS